MKLLLATTVLATAALWASAPANAVLILGPDTATEGLTYTLSEATTGNPLTDRFTLVISGENTASDTRGGRTGINAIAFTEPAAGVTGAVMVTPPTGYVFVSGGLNSTGCDASGNFYCFDNTGIPPTPAGLLSGNITFVFDVTITAGGSFAGYAPDFKIDWVGSANNYSLVSEPIPVNGGTPCTTNCGPPPKIAEPSSIALLGLGLLGLGAVTARRRR